MSLLQNITRPTLLIDQSKAENNIRLMQEKARANNMIFRPHFKTHQSVKVGRWFREMGVSACTVSSLGMAAYFAKDGWQDITVAFPFNILEIELVKTLASKIHLNLVVENLEAIEVLESALAHKVGVFVKYDTGYHRTGLQWHDGNLNKLIQRLESSGTLHFKGFLIHAGHSYHQSSKKDIKNVYLQAIAETAKLKEKYSHLKGIIYSYGDTPSCSIVEKITEFQELRAGNFVFYDLVQQHLGACKEEDIAIAMACPVVAKHPERNEIVIYGGSVHFSKDSMQDIEGKTIFGKVVPLLNNGWGKSYRDCYIKSLSQEHGILKVTDAVMEHVKIGDLLGFLPVHSCLTADKMGKYLCLNGEEMEMFDYKSL